MLKKLIINIHKVLGMILSILFLMWFLSGIVMIYHSFPKASQQLKTEKQAILQGTLPAVDSVLAVLSDSVRLRSLAVDMYLDRPVFHLRGKGMQATIYADSMKPVEAPAYPTIERIAAMWCGAPVVRVDSLREVDQWIPFGYLESEFPIYKFTFGDKEKHELYVSSKTGQVLQFTDHTQRVWAWLGAIPHWVYFTVLRQNQPVWINFVKWAAGLGAIMCVVGIWLGAQVYYQNRRNGFRSPYRKRWFRWHHISGMIFGLFALTFVFSGLMSLTDLPDWMKKSQRQVPRHGMRDGGNIVKTPAYTLDYRQVIAGIAGVKSVEWASYQRRPYYRVKTDHEEMNIDASATDTIRRFVLTEEMIRRTVREAHGDSVAYTMEQITEYDDDYFSRKSTLPLPVYRVIVADEEHTRHYFHPETLLHRQVTDDGRLRSFLYGGLHSLNFKFLADHPVLWNIVMYLLLLGGTFLSLTGVVLTVKWVGRIGRKSLKKR